MGLRASQLSAGYRGRPVLRNIDLEIPAGHVTAIIGPNGAGKTTLVRSLLGLIDPSSGQVALDEVPIGALGPRERGRRLAYIPQRGSVAFEFTVRQIVALGGHAFTRNSRAVDAALDKVALADQAQRPFSALSVGQQQRAVLARALVHAESQREAGLKPVIIADEPVSALDPLHADRSMGLLRGIADAGGVVAVVLHDLALVECWCLRTAILTDAGILLAAGPTHDVLSPRHLEGVFGVPFIRAEGSSPGGEVAAWLAAPARHRPDPSTMVS